MEKIQLWAVEGASYDGCNGWSTWIMDGSVTADKKEACKFANEHKSTYVRTEVVEYN